MYMLSTYSTIELSLAFKGILSAEVLGNTLAFLSPPPHLPGDTQPSRINSVSLEQG